jgi:membrane-bound lytic murein transglycosylase D
MYVPKLQAVKNIVSRPESFRAELPLIGNHPYFQSVTVSRDMDVALAARLADVSVEDFKALNPSMNRPVILAAGTPQILLPWDNATVFQRNFDAYNAGQYASWTAWSAPATMSVAEVARRVGMNEADLRSVNTIPPRMLVKAGSVLIVPRTAKMQNDVSSQVADHGQLSLEAEVVTRKTTVRAGKRDTVASVARRYRLNPAQVAEWNSVGASAAFKAGQQVVVYLPMRSVERSAPRTGARSARARSGAAKPAVHSSARAGTRAQAGKPSKKKR